MTMVTFTDPNRMPVLIADSLISGPDDESALITPDHPRGITEVFPPQSGYVPTRLARKTALINSNLAIAMSGGLMHMRAFREDVQAHFRQCTDCRPANVEQFLQEYKESTHHADLSIRPFWRIPPIVCTRQVALSFHGCSSWKSGGMTMLFLPATCCAIRILPGPPPRAQSVVSSFFGQTPGFWLASALVGPRNGP